MDNRVTQTKATPGELAGEMTLRPQYLSEYCGQTAAKDNLSIYIEAAKMRGEPLDHVLFYGPPGLGKTTLAGIIANEMGVDIKITSGPAIGRAGDLAAILTNLNDNDVLFIDEIHRLNRSVEEVLYSAMEDYVLDIIIGKGPAARSLRIDIAKFTLIGATTRAGSLSGPLRDRFGIVEKFEFYTPAEIKEILRRTANVLDASIDEASLDEIARRSRGTPRIGNRLIKRVRDFSSVISDGNIDINITMKALDALGVDELGLEKLDRDILTTILLNRHGIYLMHGRLRGNDIKEMISLCFSPSFDGKCQIKLHYNAAQEIVVPRTNVTRTKRRQERFITVVYRIRINRFRKFCTA